MCEYGTHVAVKLYEPNGYYLGGLTMEQHKQRLKKLGLKEHEEFIDACISPLVQTLNDFKIETMSSCCSHGKLNYSSIWINPNYIDFVQWFCEKKWQKIILKITKYLIKKLAFKQIIAIELRFPSPKR